MKRLLSVLIALGLLYTASFGQTAKKESITVKDINGKSYEITGTVNGLKISGIDKNKMVFLEFFGHRCPPCLATIPHFIKLQKKYKDKLVIMAFEVQGYDNTALKKFAENAGINYIVLSREHANNSYFVNYIAQRAQWQGGIPFLIVMDKSGEVRDIYEGFPHSDAFFEKLIAAYYEPTAAKKPQTTTK
jgi:thiol-disulfide isomerase/thioredoxin